MRKLLLGLLFVAAAAFAGNNSGWTNSGGALSTQAKTLNVTPVSSGVTDGQSVTFTGTGFGTNSAALEWAGGASGWIESGTLGNGVIQTPRSGWADDLGTTGVLATTFDNTHAWSGTKAMYATGQDGRHGLYFDMGSSSREFYLDYLFYFDNGGHTIGCCQVKFMRFVSGADGDGNMATDGGGANSNIYLRRYGDAELGLNTAGAGGTHIGPDSGDYPLTTAGWYRFRIHYKAPSSLGASDAELRIRITNATTGSSVMSLTKTGWLLLNASDHHFRYVMWQNYQGNGYELSTHSNIWMDDLLIVNGGVKHLRLCNASTYAAATQCEAATWTAWSNTSITAVVNKGGFADLTSKYWYVMSDIDTPVNSSGILLQTFFLFARRRRAANDDQYRVAA